VEEASSELKKVGELRQRVMRSGNADKLPGGTRWYDDVELLRFVRARKTLDESEQLFEKSIAWRLENHGRLGLRTVDGSFGAAHADFVSDPGAAPQWWSFLQSQALQILIGADKNGLPITYVGIGPADFIGCEREVGLEAVTLFFIMLHDHFLDMAWKRSAGTSAVDAVHGGIFIVDLKGLGFRHYRELAVLKKLGEISNSIMPERTRKHFVINAPSIFSSLFAMVKPAIHPRTQAKINIIGARGSLAPLFEEVGVENVPDFLGGTYAWLPQPACKLVEPGAFGTWQEKCPATSEKSRISPISGKSLISPASTTSRKRRSPLPTLFGLEPCCFGGG